MRLWLLAVSDTTSSANPSFFLCFLLALSLIGFSAMEYLFLAGVLSWTCSRKKLWMFCTSLSNSLLRVELFSYSRGRFLLGGVAVSLRKSLMSRPWFTFSKGILLALEDERKDFLGYWIASLVVIAMCVGKEIGDKSNGLTSYFWVFALISWFNTTFVLSFFWSGSFALRFLRQQHIMMTIMKRAIRTEPAIIGTRYFYKVPPSLEGVVAFKGWTA